MCLLVYRIIIPLCTDMEHKEVRYIIKVFSLSVE